MANEVWITGLGAVTAFGSGVEPFFRGCAENRSAITDVTLFETSDLSCHVGGVVPGDWPDRRETEFAIVAAREAAEDARLSGKFPRGEVWLGILQPDAIPLARGEEVSGSRGPDEIGARLGFSGFLSSVGTACSAAGISIALAAERIRAGISDIALAGGSASLFRAAYAGLCQIGGMAPDVCRPFDRDRQGVLIGEGAGMLVLESSERARRRGVRPYARLLGSGISCDAAHPIAMDRSGRGLRRSMEEALGEARIDPSSIDLVVSHGTGTLLNDQTESDAIATTYGLRPEVISPKPSIGHTMSASAALSAILVCRMFRERVRLGTPTLSNVDPALPRLRFPKSSLRDWNGAMAAVHAFGFGGQNVSLLLDRPN
jgi:3-oxoacyl-[acyl-carrier-protein] synthase II